MGVCPGRTIVNLCWDGRLRSTNSLTYNWSGLGETWQHIFAKIVLKGTGQEENMVCQDDQLCSGFNAGIDSATPWVQALWDENLYSEEWVLLLVYATNAYNEIDRFGMLYTVQHLWPSGDHFIFN